MCLLIVFRILPELNPQRTDFCLRFTPGEIAIAAFRYAHKDDPSFTLKEFLPEDDDDVVIPTESLVEIDATVENSKKV